MAPTKVASKKTAKAVKAKSTDGKKKRKASRVETFSTYIYKVLKQVHPGMYF
jgi:histone H2B